MWRSHFRTFSSQLLRVGTPVIAMALIGLIYFLGIRSERTGFVREVLDPGLKRITQPVLNAFYGKPPAVAQLQLALSDTTLDSLSTWYSDARASGWLAHVPSNTIGRCAIDGRVTDAFIALRPGPFDATEKRRWPLRVLLQRSDTVLQARSFDLVPVGDDRPLRSWVLSKALSDQGLPALTVSFVEVRMNDRDLGLYVMEERLDSATFARWGRGNGPVLRFDDELRTTIGTRAPTQFPIDPLPQEDWLAAPVMASQGAAVGGDVATARRYQTAVRELEDFRSGKVTVSEVFDVRSTARFFALCDVLGGQDATDWWNMRFLLDSISGSLVAFPQHGNSFGAITSIGALLEGTTMRSPAVGSGFRDRLFGDRSFFRAYVACLDSFSTAGWLEATLRSLSKEYAVQERIVISEYPQFRPDASVFAHNREVITRTLRPPDLVLAYAQADDRSEREIAVTNVHALPVELTAFIAAGDTTSIVPPVLLWPREPDKPLTYTPTRIALPRLFHGDISLVVNVLGMDEPRRVHVRSWSSFTAN